MRYRNLKLLDISKYFTPQSSPERSGGPCRNSAPLTPEKFFFQVKQCDLYSVTITIGNKLYGKLNYKEQYSELKFTIKKVYPFHGNTKYLFRFELQNNGQLHAHGILYDTYHVKFVEGFCKFGTRNLHKDSFQLCRNLEGYLEYINKENILPCLHNIQKKDIKKELIKEQSE